MISASEGRGNWECIRIRAGRMYIYILCMHMRAAHTKNRNIACTTKVYLTLESNVLSISIYKMMM